MDQEKKPEAIVTVRPVYFRTTSDDSKKSKISENNDEYDITSQTSLEEGVAERSAPKWYRRSSRMTRWFGTSSPSGRTRFRQWLRWLLVTAAILVLFGIVAAM
jgi:hypothetical protein